MCMSLNQVNEERDIRRANKLIGAGRTLGDKITGANWETR